MRCPGIMGMESKHLMICDHVNKENGQFYLDYDRNGIMIRHCRICKEYEVRMERWVSKNEISEAFNEVTDLGIIEYP